MAWELEIHHLDIRSVGDSTIVHIKDTDDPSNNKLVLIDTGTASAADIIHSYITEHFSGAKVNVIVTTHYDKDHYEGLIKLLKRSDTDIYNNAIIYDPGQPPNTDDYFRKKTSRNRFITQNYWKYIRAIKEKQNVRRATLMVNNFEIVQYDNNGNHLAPDNPSIPGSRSKNNDYRQNVVGQPSLPPFWLLGKDILWGNGGDGVPHVAPKTGNMEPLPSLDWNESIPAGAPTMKCISANKWTLQNDPDNNNRSFVSSVKIHSLTDNQINNLENGYDYRGRNLKNKNPVSLGFILQFNNFRYYIAGDLESDQEDGVINPNNEIFRNGVRQYLNPDDTMEGRVLVVRTSHHGGADSTSREFITQLRPSAAVISVSERSARKFAHPHARAINVLDGYAELPPNAIPSQSSSPNSRPQYQHPPFPPFSPYRSVPHYLTGFSDSGAVRFSDKTYGGTDSFPAGAFDNSDNLGHIVFKISEDESQRSSRGFLYRAIFYTVKAIIDKSEKLSHIDPVEVASKGSTYGVHASVASATGASVNAAMAAIAAASYIGSNDLEPESGIAYKASKKDNANDAVTYIKMADVIIPWSPDNNKKETNHEEKKIDQLVAQGIAEAIAYTVFGENVAVIHREVARQGGNIIAAKAASISGATIQSNFGNYSGAYAAAAAFGAVVMVEMGDTPDELQAAAIGAAIGVELFAENIADIVETIFDVMIHDDLGGDANKDIAALISAVAAVCIYKGEEPYMTRAIKTALLKLGTAAAAAAAAAAANKAIELTDLYDNNDLFRVSFYDANPDGRNGGIETISHKS